jgi:glycosyltransferase involved in cell wall biosynthesis
MMKILWLSNTTLTDSDGGGSGTWLQALSRGLVDSGVVELGNIAMGVVAKTTRQDCGALRQWVIPAAPGSSRNGLPSDTIVADIIKAVEEFAPDMVHVWGTECFWGLLTARKLISQPALLEMQGLKYAIARLFAGGLTAREQLACIGLREMIRPSSIRQGRKRFESWAPFEQEIIAKHEHICVQTAWVEAHVRSLNRDFRPYHCDLALRAPFYAAEPWRPAGNQTIICSSAYSAPFKGLHVAIRATAIVKQRFPNVRLQIVGGLSGGGLRQDGYVTWLKQEIGRLGIESNVEWLGALDAPQFIARMQTSAAMVIPSYIENLATSMQEAMLLGLPVVASSAGGIPSLAQDEDSALFFPMGDVEVCAFQLERLLSDSDLGLRLSLQGRSIAARRNDPRRILERQLEIYRQVIADGDGEMP